VVHSDSRRGVLFVEGRRAFRRTILLTLPRGRLRGRGAELFEDINDALAAYMRAALLACLLVGVLCTVGFVLIGVPYALLFGVVAGLLEFIPLVGPLAVALGATLVTSFHSINQALWLVAFLGALRLAQDYVVFPRLVRRGIHIHPLGVILAILSGAELAGTAGSCGDADDLPSRYTGTGVSSNGGHSMSRGAEVARRQSCESSPARSRRSGTTTHFASARHWRPTRCLRSRQYCWSPPGLAVSSSTSSMKKFRKLGLIEYNGGLKVNPSLLPVVLHD
jgi:hypothetical protein